MGSKGYDYIVIGSGLFVNVFDHEMQILGKKCLVIEKRNHMGGNTLNKIVNHIF